MVLITENLVRKRAEHNNLEISTLEEISLHQQDIERIEHLDKWCKDLKILYLQSNLIPKIENVSKLKKLEYLNLALNNIERIENLENCESLQKLDLTVNFVGELTSIESLKGLIHLNEIYLTGNPCTEYEGYRQYVIATLPQLQILDGKQIEKSERILAKQELGVIKGYIIEQQNRHKKKREKEKEQIRQHEEQKKSNKKKNPTKDGRWYTDINKSDKTKDVPDGKGDNEDDTDACSPHKDTESKEVTVENVEDDEDDEEEITDEKDKEFWDEKVPFTPESRVAVHAHMKKVKDKEDKKNKPKPKPPRKMFSEDGRPLNVNEAKIDFTLLDDEEQNAFVLDVACFKHMDTSLIDCDVQTNYVRVTLKGKVFQLHLAEDVNPDASTAKRSQITGNLLVTMPKVKEVIKAKKSEYGGKQNKKDKENIPKERPKEERLEVDESARKAVDIGNIVSDKKGEIVPPLGHRNNRYQLKERENSEDFVDDPDVPPLE